MKENLTFSLVYIKLVLIVIKTFICHLICQNLLIKEVEILYHYQIHIHNNQVNHYSYYVKRRKKK